jgi:hypothetical protein
MFISDCILYYSVITCICIAISVYCDAYGHVNFVYGMMVGMACRGVFFARNLWV